MVHAAPACALAIWVVLTGISGISTAVPVHAETPTDAVPVDPTQMVLCRLGDECRLTTLERCLAKGGIVDPPWEECAPILEGVPSATPEQGTDCHFPAEIAIRGRNRLVYRNGPYERTFGPGTYLAADFEDGRFRIADTLLVVPPPRPEVLAGDLRRLGSFFGVQEALRANVLGESPITVTDAGEPSEEMRTLKREDACAWLQILQLLRRSVTSLEVHLADGHLTLMMVPLERSKTASGE